MKTRVLISERMDDPSLDLPSHLHALRGLRRINRWTGNAALAWTPIWDLARELKGNRLRVLDIATGAGDIPIGLWKKSRQYGLQLEIEACDVSRNALEFAADNCKQAGAEVRLFPLNVLQDSIIKTYDVVMCSQFLHHLDDSQAQAVLEKMTACAQHRIVVIDLLRSALNWLQVWVASHAVTRSPVVHFDGPQSVRAAFTVAEMEAIARRAKLSKFEIRQHWPCRFVFTARVNKAEEN